jgi:hypothetical protein
MVPGRLGAFGFCSCLDGKLLGVVRGTAIITALRRQKQEDLEFKAKLGCR